MDTDEEKRTGVVPTSQGYFFFLYFLNLSKYCVKPIYMYMVLMEAYVFVFFLLVFFFFFNNFFLCVCVLYKPNRTSDFSLSRLFSLQISRYKQTKGYNICIPL